MHHSEYTKRYWVVQREREKEEKRERENLMPGPNSRRVCFHGPGGQPGHQNLRCQGWLQGSWLRATELEKEEPENGER